VTGEALISHDVIASYAADAVRDVAGVDSVVDRHLPTRRGIRVAETDGRIDLEVHVAVEWGASIPAVGAEVQQRVSDYLARMADLRPASVEVVVDEVALPS
jgi:uncharacterized alkaline shock family protein YloU